MHENLSLVVMTKEMCHRFYRSFQHDPAVFAPGQSYREFTYDAAWVEEYWREQDVPDRRVFAVMLGERMIGEVKLKYIDFDKRECSMGIHMLNDSVKGKGYGTQAERLILQYAFEELGMLAVNADALHGNARSQHVLEKVGFRYIGSDDAFKYYRCDRRI